MLMKSADNRGPVYVGVDVVTVSAPTYTYTVTDVVNSYRIVSIEREPRASEDIIEGEWTESSKKLLQLRTKGNNHG